MASLYCLNLTCRSCAASCGCNPLFPSAISYLECFVKYLFIKVYVPSLVCYRYLVLSFSLFKCYESAPVASGASDIVYCHIISATCVSQVFMLSNNPFLYCFINRIGEFFASDLLASNLKLDVLRVCNLMLWLVKRGQPSYRVA